MDIEQDVEKTVASPRPPDPVGRAVVRWFWEGYWAIGISEK
jgi:hypothetical protein